MPRYWWNKDVHILRNKNVQIVKDKDVQITGIGMSKY